MASFRDDDDDDETIEQEMIMVADISQALGMIQQAKRDDPSVGRPNVLCYARRTQRGAAPRAMQEAMQACFHR